MKKFMCYLGIVFLLILIAIPPILRNVDLTGEEEKKTEVQKMIVESITCSKDDSIIVYTYTNSDFKWLRITYNNSVEFKETDLEYKFFPLVHTQEHIISNENIVGDKVFTIDTVKIEELSEEEKANLSEYTKEYANMKMLLESNNYVCKETKMEN